MKKHLLPLALIGLCATASAAPVTYDIEPTHTFPSFEADHFGGMSVWRGKFNKTSGKLVIDKEGGSGSVDITIDINSIDYGLDAMNAKARSPELFDAKKFPKAYYKGTFAGYTNGVPSRVDGELTLHGVTKPLTLALNSVKCMPHPMLKRDFCGADAIATLNRDDFGISAGKDWGFKMDVTLRIQVEAVAAKEKAKEKAKP